MTSRRALLAAGFAMAAAPALAEGPFDGAWNGILSAGSLRLRLRLIVRGNTATLYSLDQSNAEIPAGSVTLSGEAIRAVFPSINASYEGRLVGGRIEGTFTQGATMPLAFVRGQPEAASAAGALTTERLEALRAGAGSPAMGAMSLNRDGRRFEAAVGMRAVGREGVTTNDKWHLGSITKSMTATLVARAVEAGAVSWDDSVGDLLGADAAKTAYGAATFRHLLSHRAGLQANLPTDRLVSYARENPAPIAERRAYAMEALAQVPAGSAGETFVYSNSGYVIAGAMLEERLGEAWETLIRARVFDPLRMDGAGFGAPGIPGAFDQPVGHGPGLIPYPPGGAISDNPAALGPAGRVHAPLADLLRFATAHCERIAFLRPESWDILHTPPFGGEYAMGLTRRGDSLWHNGLNTLWYAEMIIDRSRGVVAAAAANDGRRDHSGTPVGEALIGAVAAVA